MTTDLLPDAVVRYAAFDEGLIDLHVPEDPNGTLVVLVHGGFWKQVWDRTHTRAQARALAGLGYLVATPEYRRVDGNGGWPTTADDVRVAYDALPDLLAGLDLTWDRVATIGHSAGGHLVLWLAAQDLDVPPDRTVALAPVADLVLARELDLGTAAVDAFLGGAPITDADPTTLHDAAPVGGVVLVHGDLDETVPISLSRSFAAAHRWARLVELADTDHFEFLDPSSAAFAASAEALARS